VVLTLYVPSDSPVHRLHPVTKTASLLAVIVAGFLVDRPLVLAPLPVALLALLVAVGGGDNLRRFRLMFVLVFVFTLVVWTFFGDTESTGQPTRAGFFLGLSTAVRLATFLAAGLVFLSATRVEEVAYALGRVGVPYKVGFTLTLAFRLVPLFFDAATTILDAQRCRGLDAAAGGVVARLRRFALLIVPVFVGALRRADRMAMALELRGFNSGRPRTTFRRPAPAARDAVAVAVTLVVLAVYGGFWLRGMGRLVP
jgi:energy-coupling factor transport system permease protein